VKSQKPFTENCMFSLSVPIGYVNVEMEDGKFKEIMLRDMPLFPVVSKDDLVFCPDAAQKIVDYFRGKQPLFTGDDIHPDSLTSFQTRLCEILWKVAPYGKVTTYGKLARILSSSPRGVATALKYNPLPIVLPCHRVLAKNGIGGFSAGLKWKRYLLNLEGVNI